MIEFLKFDQDAIFQNTWKIDMGYIQHVWGITGCNRLYLIFSRDFLKAF